jgi:hypothetical protein
VFGRLIKVLLCNIYWDFSPLSPLRESLGLNSSLRVPAWGVCPYVDEGLLGSTDNFLYSNTENVGVLRVLMFNFDSFVVKVSISLGRLRFDFGLTDTAVNAVYSI